MYATNDVPGPVVLTETKKLLVPSTREKKSPGKSFSHVSSP